MSGNEDCTGCEARIALLRQKMGVVTLTRSLGLEVREEHVAVVVQDADFVKTAGRTPGGEVSLPLDY